MDRPFLEKEEALDRVLGDLSGLDIVDLGCGCGALARQLAARGATVVGVEPNATAFAAAVTTDASGAYLPYWARVDVFASASETTTPSPLAR